MKILFVVPGMGYGGAERVISILANSFVIKEYKVKIIIINSIGESVYKLNENVEIEAIPSANRKKSSSVYGLLKSIRRITQTYNPDVIISFMNDTCAITALANLGTHNPIIYSERNDPLNTNMAIKDRIFRCIVQICAEGFVFQSNGAKALYPKKVQNKSTVILNPINIKNLPQQYDGERRKEIVSVGRLHPQKNQQMLIRAFSHIATEYSDYNLLIYGEGTLREFLQQQIVDLGMTERVFLMGDTSNVLEKINTASIFAFSSNYEGLPNALMEAMALGLPSISTDCSPGGAAMLIENYVNGILVPVGDEEQFAEGLRYLLSHQQKSIEMGNEAKKIIGKTKETIIVAEWEKFILNTTQKGNSKE